MGGSEILRGGKGKGGERELTKRNTATTRDTSMFESEVSLYK